MLEISGIMRSSQLEEDFELLLQSSSLREIVDDGFATESDIQQGVFTSKKNDLTYRVQDFKEITNLLDHSDLHIRGTVNRRWGTSERLLSIVEQKLGKSVSHGALLLALDLRGMRLERIESRKDAYLSISNKSKFN